MNDGFFIQSAADTPLAPFVGALLDSAAQAWRRGHGDLPRWQAAIDSLPTLSAEHIELDRPTVGVQGAPLGAGQREALHQALQQLHPWRKGPFRLHGVTIDSEWRSDLKWARVAPHLDDLRGRLVLDVGCGNGYYAWRMLGAGARLVLGIDPTLLFIKQFEVVEHFLGSGHPLFLLPLGIEDLPARMGLFDTLFSMGVFYHRRSPFDHLLELHGLLRPGGQLVLETLLIPGQAGEVLVPQGRYAKMRNVWFIPSAATLLDWLQRAGFRQARLLEQTPTTSQEQRRTEWMRFESLADFLDPEHPGRTIEGHPAPMRGLFLAQK
ncbi:tRNA 5-methoxyuridine(34)/uridine 5-oxyacetic acid(34) synthase CmoB [Magnetovirga frankeli]|uniref:tRNA 5-methoxyuridine(34)/uridine 5-oxyacetic acid(34) synthase CmoB n=1 Tax=Magnetovirga frankeli TaxID=947516 RepID=UPI001293867F|nr:tRNA 5-methoxyuridine(34)/uridine 5-oxyacetic acid(34) synthase CmoB [gamma proteobacterium SS-5]